MPVQGTLAITARGDGSRWYGRISISVETALAANLKEGVRITARCADGMIIIQADEQGRIKFPGVKGKADPKHAFEAATTTLGLKEVKYSQSVIPTEVSEGQITIRIPEDCLAAEEKKRKKAKKETSRPSTEPARVMAQSPQGTKMWGTAAAIVTEAGRSGKLVKPMSLKEVIELIQEKGSDLQPMGPRFFKLNGRSVTISDLLDEANKLSGSTEQNRIALIMD